MNKYILRTILFIIILFIIIFVLFISVNPVKKYMGKAYILKKIDKKYTLSLQIINNIYDIYKIKEYPVVFKPDMCSGTNNGVKLINNRDEAIDLLKKNKSQTYIVQKLYNSKYEAMILYERHPFLKDGRIISIVFKEIPNKWHPLRCNVSHFGIKDKNFTKCIDASNLITAELNKVFNNISKKIPYFYAGRYDIRFSNIEDFKKGKNFSILELNGVMGVDGRILLLNKNIMYINARWCFIRLLIGLQNILLLNGHNIFLIPIILINCIKQTIKCNYKIGYLFSTSNF